MGSRGIGWADAVGRRIGLSGVDYTPTDIGQTLHVPCSRGHTVDFTITGKMPPEVVAKKMLQEGWTVGRKLVCPDHNRKNPAPTPKKDKALMSDTSKTAIQARRAALEWLMESFDPETGRYKAGISDASIAAETGLAEAAVAKLRQENFGELREPAEIEQARAELNRMEERIDKFEKECAATIEQWRRDVVAHRNRLGALISKNNWKE